MDRLSDSKAFLGIAGQKRDMNLYTLKWNGNKPTKAHSSYKTVPLVLSDILPRSEWYTKSLLSNIQQVFKNFTPFHSVSQLPHDFPKKSRRRFPRDSVEAAAASHLSHLLRVTEAVVASGVRPGYFFECHCCIWMMTCFAVFFMHFFGEFSGFKKTWLLYFLGIGGK